MYNTALSACVCMWLADSVHYMVCTLYMVGYHQSEEPGRPGHSTYMSWCMTDRQCTVAATTRAY